MAYSKAKFTSNGDKASTEVIIIMLLLPSYHRFFPGISPLEPVVNPTTQASGIRL
jgi:hypothetical protein